MHGILLLPCDVLLPVQAAHDNHRPEELKSSDTNLSQTNSLPRWHKYPTLHALLPFKLLADDACSHEMTLLQATLLSPQVASVSRKNGKREQYE